MRVKLIKCFILFLSFIGVLFFISTSKVPAINDHHTGLYYVHGSKIVTYYRCPFIDLCGPDDGPFHDTTRIASVVAVKWIEEKTDTLHFFGLPGADEGETKFYHGTTQLSSHVGGMLHYDNLTRYRVYGLMSGSSIEIEINNAGNRYTGTGTLSDKFIDIRSQKTFRTITVDYELTGEKIYNIK